MDVCRLAQGVEASLLYGCTHVPAASSPPIYGASFPIPCSKVASLCSRDTATRGCSAVPLSPGHLPPPPSQHPPTQMCPASGVPHRAGDAAAGGQGAEQGAGQHGAAEAGGPAGRGTAVEPVGCCRASQQQRRHLAPVFPTDPHKPAPAAAAAAAPAVLDGWGAESFVVAHGGREQGSAHHLFRHDARPSLPNLPCWQPVRSFKVRGAYNRMCRLTPEQVGVVGAACRVGCGWVGLGGAGHAGGGWLVGALLYQQLPALCRQLLVEKTRGVVTGSLVPPPPLPCSLCAA